MRKSMYIVLASLAAAFLVVLPVSSWAESWPQAIANVERLRKQMEERADDLGYPVHLGTAYNEYKVKEHECAILGRMLGKTDAIAHLEEELPRESRDGSEFRFAALSLSNWIFTAKRLLDEPFDRRVSLWNLNCVGSLGISRTEFLKATDPNGQPEFFDITDDGSTLRILGPVTDGFSDRVIDALNKNPQVKVVALGSPGGSVTEALTAGLAIRQRGLETTLWNNCLSACPLVFLAGVRRSVWSPYPDLGFHQISRDGQAVAAGHEIYGLVRDYVRLMGVNDRVVIDLMMSAAPSDMNIPDMQTLCEAKIANWVQRVCFSD